MLTDVRLSIRNETFGFVTQGDARFLSPLHLNPLPPEERARRRERKEKGYAGKAHTTRFKAMYDVKALIFRPV